MSQQIDIDYKEVIDWMEKRHKLSKDWIQKLKAAKLKTKQLLEQANHEDDLEPELKSTIEEYLNQDYEFSFYDLNNLIQKLQNSKKAQNKTFFGGFADKFIKEWDTIYKFYKKNNLNISDLAKIISQSTTFEIPALQKQSQNFENQIQSINQKILDSQSSIKQLQQDYEKNCQKLGVQGSNLKQEVPKLVQNLLQHFQNIEKHLKDPKIHDMLVYYDKFTQYTLNPKKKQQQQQQKNASILPTLNFVNENGDEVKQIFESKLKNPDHQISDQEKQLQENKYLFYQYFGNLNQKKESESTQIDWSAFGITAVGTGKNSHQSENQDNINNNLNNLDNQNNEINQDNQNNEINWDIQIENTGDKKEDEINWDIQVEPQQQDSNNSQNQNQNQDAGGINWDISAQINDNSQNLNEVPKEAETEIPTIISDLQSRNQLITELNELFYFLKQRKSESKSHSTNSLLQMYETNADNQILFDLQVDQLEEYIEIIKNIIDKLTNYQFRQLLIIKEQPKSQERIINSLHIYQENIQKQQKNIADFEKRIQAAQNSIQETKPKLKELTNLTIQQRDFLEQIMTEVIKNPVKITGDAKKLKKIK